jgi:hypothetical protein
MALREDLVTGEKTTGKAICFFREIFCIFCSKAEKNGDKACNAASVVI